MSTSGHSFFTGRRSRSWPAGSRGSLCRKEAWSSTARKEGGQRIPGSSAKGRRSRSCITTSTRTPAPRTRNKGRSEMLSRVAENLYWISRYVERAENVARLLDVGFHLELDASGLT